MDSQQPTSPQPQQPVQTPQMVDQHSAQSQSVIAPSEPEKHSGKHMLFFFGGVVVIAALIVGVYMYISNMSLQTANIAPPASQQGNSSQNANPAVLSDPLTQDLNMIDVSVTKLAQDEKSVDQGLNDQQINLN